MIESVFGPGTILECMQLKHPPSQGELMYWALKWREEIQAQYDRMQQSPSLRDRKAARYSSVRSAA
jgi:hypothetical protein